MTTTHTVSGTVTGTGGEPLPGTYVHAFDSTGNWVGYTVAGSGGAYSLTLAAGTFKLYIQPVAAGYSNTWHGGTDFDSASSIDLTTTDQTVDISLVGG